MELTARRADEPLPPRTARLVPELLARLRVGTCDYLLVTADRPAGGQRTLVKAERLLPRGCSASGAASTVLLSDDALEALGACSEEAFAVRLIPVRAASLQRWTALQVRPRGEALAAPRLPGAPPDVPSDAELAHEVWHRQRRATHPWRLDCRCDGALLPRSSELLIDCGARPAPLRCTLVCAADPSHPRADPCADGSPSGAEDLAGEIIDALRQWGIAPPTTQLSFALLPRAAPDATDAITATGRPEWRTMLRLLLRRLHDGGGGGAACCSVLLLSGPTGVGKTAAARECCAHAAVPLVHARPYELCRRGAPADGLRALLRTAERCAPCAVILEHAEVFGSPSAEAEADWGVLHAIASFHRSAAPGILLILECADPSLLHPLLCASADLALSIPLPSAPERAALVSSAAADLALAPPPPALLRAIARRMHGLTAADIAAVCSDARLSAVRCACASAASDAAVAAAVTVATEAEWLAASGSARPSALLGVGMGERDLGDASWRQIGGLAAVKRRLRQLVQWPLDTPDLCARLGLGGPRGVLLYGPPGTGKTLLVRTLAAESGLSLIAAHIPQLMRAEVGGSERALTALFARARAHRPCLLLLDELQALFGGCGGGDGGGGGRVQRQLLTQLLVELDGASAEAASDDGGALVIVGATNTPEALDGALLRPGRLEHAIYVPPPDPRARASILRARIRRMPLERADIELAGISADDLADRLSARTEGCTGADLDALCQKAALLALARCRPNDVHAARAGADAMTDAAPLTVRADDFENAMRALRPSVTPAMLERLEAWTATRAAHCVGRGDG